jgi:hypothetical protein
MRLEQIGEMTFVLGRQVDDDNERETTVWANMRQQRFQGVQSASRGADRDDGSLLSRAVVRSGSSARRGPGGSGQSGLSRRAVAFAIAHVEAVRAAGRSEQNRNTSLKAR